MLSNSVKHSILIVDDNKNNLQVIAGTLSAQGYKLAFALSAKDALRFIEKKIPDLILLDIMMPEMSGIELCKMLKAKPEYAQIPIIFVTAKSDPVDLEEGFKAGGVDYITKPFSKPELISRVSNHLSLKHAKDELQNALNAKDKLMSIIGHDLRGPLGSVVSLLKMLADKTIEIPEQQKAELIDMLETAAEGAYSLLENLLAWSRAQTGTIEVEEGVFSLGDIFHDVLGTAGLSFNEKQLELQQSDFSNMAVNCDYKLTTTVFRNLITNAIKFTPAGGKISVTVQNDEDEYVVSVKDSGIGMDEETQKKVLDPTNHYSTYGTNEEKGTGLGLGLCVEFVRLMNGRIWVESEPGKGSTFFVALPSAKVS